MALWGPVEEPSGLGRFGRGFCRRRGQMLQDSKRFNADSAQSSNDNSTGAAPPTGGWIAKVDAFCRAKNSRAPRL